MPDQPTGPRVPADPYDDVPHGIWESVFLTRPGGTPYKDGHYETQCKVCRSEFPDHAPDCTYHALYIENARLRMRLEEIQEAALTVWAFYDDHGLPIQPGHLMTEWKGALRHLYRVARREP